MPRLVISEELLNALVDNELEPVEKDQAFDEIARDESLRNQVRHLRELKAMVQHAYEEPPVQHPYAPAYRQSPVKQNAYSLRSLAACFMLLAIGGMAGWLLAKLGTPQPRQDMALLFPAMSHNGVRPDSSRIVIQVSNSNPVRLESALDESEKLLRTSRRAHKNLQVEVIANNSGVDLLRSDVSHYARRIAVMKAKYPNLKFLACGLTLDRLKKKGVKVHLLPNTGSVPSAPDEITRRLHQGWDYIRM